MYKSAINKVFSLGRTLTFSTESHNLVINFFKDDKFNTYEQHLQISNYI